LFWRRISRRDLAAGIAVLVALYLPFWDGRGFPIGSVPQVVERFRFNGPIFAALASGAGPAAAAALAILVGLTAAALARRWLSVASPQGWAWPMAATLLCAPLVYPWYLVWLTPFVAGAAMMPIAIWTVSILITYVVWQLPAEQWVVPQWALLVEYGALLVAAFWLLWRRKQVTARSPSYSTPPA
ncbi:MAG: hypothetical protein ACJ79C_00710, partial [Myxococcales bacterium]